MPIKLLKKTKKKMYGIKSYPFRPSFCVFALYLPFCGIYNYILLFSVSLVIIIIIIIIIIIMIIIIIIMIKR